MAIESKTYTAGNSDGKLSSVMDYIRLLNDEENNIPNTPTIISVTDKKTENMFNNTSGVTLKEYEIEAQRASNQAEDLQLGGKLWEKEEKEESDKIMEFAEHGIEEREREERERLSRDDLNALPWTGDKNEIWDLGDGIVGTREELFKKGMSAWDKAKKEAEKRGLNEKEKDDLNKLYEKYLDAIKKGNKEAAKEYKGQMPDWAQKDLEDNNKFQTSNTVQQFDARKAQDIGVSTISGSDLIANIQNDVVADGAVKTPVSAKTDFEKVAPNIAAPTQQIAQIDVKPQADVKQTFNYDMGFG
jgi:hypothetical protein